MRQVFSSGRIENAEAVARLLEDEGIEVRVENGRGFRSSIRGNFSYREQHGAGPRAAVWVVRSDDQPRARRLLREAGLLDQSPTGPGSFLPDTGHAAKATSTPKRARAGLGLLIVAAVALALWLNQFRNPGWDLPPPAAGAAPAVPLDPALQPILSGTEAVHRVPVPPALAAMLAAQAQAADGRVCLAVDGADAGDATLAAARAAGLEPQPASACEPDAGALHVAVDDYRTDGSGTGSVQLVTGRGGDAGEARRLEVRREGNEWRILRTL